MSTIIFTQGYTSHAGQFRVDGAFSSAVPFTLAASYSGKIEVYFWGKADQGAAIVYTVKLREGASSPGAVVYTSNSVTSPSTSVAEMLGTFNNISLAAGTKYWIQVTSNAAGGSGKYAYTYGDSTDAAYAGTTDSGSTWSVTNNYRPSYKVIHTSLFNRVSFFRLGNRVYPIEVRNSPRIP